MNHENIWGHKKFPNQIDPNEQIVLILRKDSSLLKNKLTKGFIIIILAIFVKFYLQNYLNFADNTAWFYFINTVYYSFICLQMLIFSFFCHNYFLSFWAITPLRIIEFKQNNFFQADINSIWYKNIEKIEIKGQKVANTLNNFGDIVLKMKGEGEQQNTLVLSDLPTPKYILELITSYLN
jgi:hypothetical protein